MSDIWKGVALPWDNTIRGTIDPKDDEDVIKSSVVWIILTRLGERVMLPEFGSAVPDAVFEPNDSQTVTWISSSIENAIRRWDDRVVFLSVDIRIVENTMHVKVHYKNAKDPNESAVRIAAFQVTPSGFIF